MAHLEGNQTMTLTFGDFAENHKGMEKIGHSVHQGLSLEDLMEARDYFREKGFNTNLLDLNRLLEEEVLEEELEPTSAYLLIVRNGVGAIVNPDELYAEQNVLEKDTKAFMYGRVVNKKARHNLCFSDFSQEADYESGKGTVHNFSNLNLLRKVREEIPNIIKRPDLVNLQCEGNYYYDIENTYIGFHGDTERKIVIGVRLGKSFNLYYQWYYKGKAVGNILKAELNHGDIYFMSDMAVGYNWKRSSIYTLRHAAAKNPKLIGL